EQAQPQQERSPDDQQPAGTGHSRLVHRVPAALPAPRAAPARYLRPEGRIKKYTVASEWQGGGGVGEGPKARGRGGGVRPAGGARGPRLADRVVGYSLPGTLHASPGAAGLSSATMGPAEVVCEDAAA